MAGNTDRVGWHGRRRVRSVTRSLHQSDLPRSMRGRGWPSLSSVRPCLCALYCQRVNISRNSAFFLLEPGVFGLEALDLLPEAFLRCRLANRMRLSLFAILEGELDAGVAGECLPGRINPQTVSDSVEEPVPCELRVRRPAVENADNLLPVLLGEMLSHRGTPEAIPGVFRRARSCGASAAVDRARGRDGYARQRPRA